VSVNSEVVAAAWVCVRDRRLLVVRSAGSDAFYVPGGKPEPGESWAEAAAREVGEETGIVLRASTDWSPRIDCPKRTLILATLGLAGEIAVRDPGVEVEAELRRPVQHLDRERLIISRERRQIRRRRDRRE
jgi:8-oxo-dGTP pyrophosphatase MutT (NUDIX family)